MVRSMQPRTGALAAAIAFALATGATAALAKSDDGFAGSWLLTQVGGGGVARSILRLTPDGHATMRTDFSRYTSRPERAAPVPPVLERGTWTRRGDRAVVHFVTSSSEDNVGDTQHRPQFDEVLFTRSGCQLRLVSQSASASAGFGEHGVEFTKPHCTVST